MIQFSRSPSLQQNTTEGSLPQEYEYDRRYQEILSRRLEQAGHSNASNISCHRCRLPTNYYLHVVYMAPEHSTAYHYPSILIFVLSSIFLSRTRANNRCKNDTFFHTEDTIPYTLIQTNTASILSQMRNVLLLPCFLYILAVRTLSLEMLWPAAPSLPVTLLVALITITIITCIIITVGEWVSRAPAAAN